MTETLTLFPKDIPTSPKADLSVGFTGTQQGMTQAQKYALKEFFENLDADVVDFHHGDCIGADMEAALLAQSLNFRILGHPPLNSSKRAFFPSNFEQSPKEYLVRNHDIVDASEYIIATPKEAAEQLRSGTWATIRYALKSNKPVFKIHPNGETEWLPKQ